MTVKNVLKGLRSKYAVTEINIITGERVVFSGTTKQWDTMSDPYLLERKRKILESTVKNEMTFNEKKVFIFI